ncbi:hypothetical protein, partial [Bradyrhizobium sp. 179]|uniref:hypothetical protein n=1 Tax=Bradyrhizobium sp. 179 TaxID=2782648 RepID=UPI001FF81DDC
MSAIEMPIGKADLDAHPQSFPSGLSAEARRAKAEAKIPWGWIATKSEARLRLHPFNLETTMLLDHPI